MSMPLSVSSAVRAAGPAMAMMVPRSTRFHLIVRAKSLAGTDAAARRIDPHGLAILSITPDKGEEFSPPQAMLLSQALPTAAWTVANLAAIAALDRVRLPRVVKALALGAGVYVLDSMMTQLVEKALAMRDSQVATDTDPAEV